jgi:hypothetical protein
VATSREGPAGQHARQGKPEHPARGPPLQHTPTTPEPSGWTSGFEVLGVPPPPQPPARPSGVRGVVTKVQHTRQGTSEHPARRPPPPRAPLPSEQATAWSSRLGLPPQPAAPDRASRGEQIRPNDILGTADINYPTWVSSSSTKDGQTVIATARSGLAWTRVFFYRLTRRQTM